jgi:uncharacterized SAM-binding protein YcdF (DUF218 family)
MQLGAKGQIHRRGRKRRGLLAAVAALVLLASAVVAFGRAGAFLMVADPLEHAQAVAVFGGGVLFRAMEAAAIYRAGWAQEVWITQAVLHPEDIALAKLGIDRPSEDAYSRLVLLKLGVPAEKIRVLSERILNTAEEVQLISKELRARNGSCVILVTSKYHARRVKFLWRRLVGDQPRAIVRYARADPFDPGQWWHNSRDALAVYRELFGLFNAWAGFPLKSQP